MYVPISTDAAPTGWWAEFGCYHPTDGSSPHNKIVTLPVAAWITMRDFSDVKAGNVIVPGVMVDGCPQMIPVDDTEAVAEALKIPEGVDVNYMTTLYVASPL